MGIEKYDDYNEAAKYAVSFALANDTSGRLLRSVETLMDAVETIERIPNQGK